ncbi:MAG: hypothetical protein KatS3mg124_1563 [Porticoccaceae bacterium]|nr:MAG: hypothetical protein KatS3mg124_1563 [Porticoccaceae bacterium]
MRLNGLASHHIVPGQDLRLPDAAAAGTSGPTHRVQRGETLSAIAARYGVSVAALKARNRLRGDLIHPGQVLFLPEGDPAGARLAAGGTSAVHRVRRGDTLWEIARRYRISVTTLARYNGIAKDAPLHPGQRIAIPAAGTLNSAASRSPLTTASLPVLESDSVLVVDARSGKTLVEKNPHQVRSIASITKLMTAMVTLDAKLPMDELLTIGPEDVDRLKGSSSRLPVGTRLSRRQLLHLALMSSENRAASALSRHYPGGKSAFVAAMNAKAQALGMERAHFVEATGLDPRNAASAADLVRLVAAAARYPLIRRFTTDVEEWIRVPRAGTLQYRNTNLLVRSGRLPVELSKTGYIREAGRCLVMQARIGDRPAYLVFLRSNRREAPVQDALRIARWLESGASGIDLAAL